jgi:hypothetical protein
MSSLLQIPCQPDGRSDVSRLCSLVAARQEDYDRRSAVREVNPVPRAVIDPQFANAFTDRPGVASASGRQTLNPNL